MRRPNVSKHLGRARRLAKMLKFGKLSGTGLGVKTNVRNCDRFLPTHTNRKKKINYSDESGIRTHAPEETRSLVWRLRPLGHLAFREFIISSFRIDLIK